MKYLDFVVKLIMQENLTIIRSRDTNDLVFRMNDEKEIYRTPMEYLSKVEDFSDIYDKIVEGRTKWNLKKRRK